MSVNITPGGLLALRSGATAVLGATALNRSGTELSGYTATWSSADPRIASVVEGVVTGHLTGSTSVTAEAGGATSAPVMVTVSAGASTQLVLRTAAAGAVSGAAFTTQPVVTLFDAEGNAAVADDTTVVQMKVSAGASVIGRAKATASNGVVAFAGIGIGATIGPAYTLTFVATGSSPATQTITPSAGPRAYRNYFKTSYELSLAGLWLSSADLFSNGAPYTDQNPLLVQQTTQLDIDGDGLEDLLTYDSYPLTPPLQNPPPSVFVNDGTHLNKIAWMGPTLRDPHGVKLLVGDFDNDGTPDVFSLVAVDPPGGGFPDLKDFNNLLFNSPSGFNRVKEFDDQLGFYYTGASGDIDNDGALDVIMFNFHVGANGVQSRILWNDGLGTFTYDPSGIGDIQQVDHAELFDVNHDSYLDLVINYVSLDANLQRLNHLAVMWGNGHGFGLAHSTSFTISGDRFLSDIGFTDIDSDGYQEVIVASGDSANVYYVDLYKTDDLGTSFALRTADYIDNNVSNARFDHIRVQDIDNNGRTDIFAIDKKDGIRWEWNGVKFIKQ